MSSDVTFRRATAADYNDVMAINRNVYKGMDYLPVRYREYLTDPDRHMFVALVDGRVVAFLIRYVTGGGTLSATQATRTHPDYAGRGLSRDLGLHSYLAIKDRYPNLSRSAYTALNREGVMSSLKKMPFQRLVTTRSRFAFDFNVGALDGIMGTPAFRQLQRTSFLNTRELPTGEAMAVLSEEINATKFIPEGLLIVDWEPFEPHRINYQIILKESPLFVTRDEKTREIRALSFLTTVAVKRGWRCRADFYRLDKDNDPHLTTAHVLAHMQKINKFQDRRFISYSVLYPENYPGSVCREELQSQLGLTRGDPYLERPGLLVVYDNKDYLKANAKL